MLWGLLSTFVGVYLDHKKATNFSTYPRRTYLKLLARKELRNGHWTNFYLKTWDFTLPATLRHYSRLVALFATIRYALFGFFRHPAQNATNFNKQIIEFRSQLSNVCPFVLLRSIHAKIQALNSKLFHHLEQTKKHKLENLTNPLKNRTAPLENQNHHTVLTIPEDLPVSNAEKSTLSKGL